MQVSPGSGGRPQRSWHSSLPWWYFTSHQNYSGKSGTPGEGVWSSFSTRIMINPKNGAVYKAVDYLGYRVTGEGLPIQWSWRRPWDILVTARNFSLNFPGWPLAWTACKRSWDGKMETGIQGWLVNFGSWRIYFAWRVAPVALFPCLVTREQAKITLTTEYSKEAMSGVLHQVQHGVERFIGAKGRKCQWYERNFHSSKTHVFQTP